MPIRSTPMPTHEYTALTGELTREAIDVLLSVAGPGSRSPQTVVEVRLLGGGALAREPRHRSAFCHRDADFALMVAGVLAPATADDVIGHARTLDRGDVALDHRTPAAELSRPIPIRTPSPRAYDDDTWHWLGALADEHDSEGVLRVGHVVRRDR